MAVSPNAIQRRLNRQSQGDQSLNRKPSRAVQATPRVRPTRAPELPGMRPQMPDKPFDNAPVYQPPQAMTNMMMPQGPGNGVLDTILRMSMAGQNASPRSAIQRRMSQMQPYGVE